MPQINDNNYDDYNGCGCNYAPDRDPSKLSVAIVTVGLVWLAVVVVIGVGWPVILIVERLIRYFK